MSTAPEKISQERTLGRDADETDIKIEQHAMQSLILDEARKAITMITERKPNGDIRLRAFLYIDRHGGPQ